MSRIGVSMIAIGLGLVVCTSSSLAQDQDGDVSPDARKMLQFLQGLRERGYHDVARDYLESLRADASAPADVKEMIDYQLGRGLLEEATTTGDLERKADLLEKARAQLDQFAKQHPKHPLVAEALVQMARQYVERGHTALLQGNESKDKAEINAKLAQARASFKQAREAYANAETRLKAAFAAFPKFIENGNPKLLDRDRAHKALMDDQLQKAIVDYEEAQTYPIDSGERNQLLDKAIAAFEQLYKDYRTQLAGLYARMFQGKCYEEKGGDDDRRAAMGIYKELMDQPSPELRELKRQVAYYQIIIDGKRGENGLAVDRAVAWINQNPRHLVSEVGLGVQLELAKNILAQLDSFTGPEREEAIRKSVDRLQVVARYTSKYKPEAVELLKKHRKSASARPEQIANMTFDQAMSEASNAVDSSEWDRAITLFRQAIHRADPQKDIEKVNVARQSMAYAYYKAGKFYAAAALAEHLARRYPRGVNSPNAASIGMAAYTDAYYAVAALDRASDLDRLVDLARYAAETWPETETADTARFTTGEVLKGRGQYAEAAKAFESVRESSSRRLDAIVKAGEAHFFNSAVLRAAGKTAEADAEAKIALEVNERALKTRRDSGVPVTDPGFIVNATNLAEIHRVGDRPKDAVALLDPIAKALAATPGSADTAPIQAALLTTLLKSHLAAGMPNNAIADIKVLEAVSPNKETLTQLYFDLARSLKKEMDALEAKRDRVGYTRTQAAYKQFLQALVDSPAGQTFDSLEWAGASMLDLGLSKEANAVFDKIMSDKKFAGDSRIGRIRVRQASALRKQKQFDKAEPMLNDLIKQNPRDLGLLMERGYLYSDAAKAEKSQDRWKMALAQWKTLSTQLEKIRPRRIEYFECTLQVADALYNLGRKTEAARTLKGVMTLAPQVGSAEMKAKYQAALQRWAQ